MKEYIERAKLYEAMNSQNCEFSLIDALALIEEFPAVDVMEVVRCRECRHFNLKTHECENELLSTDHESGASYSLNFYDDDFCSYGEWREIDHD